MKFLIAIDVPAAKKEEVVPEEMEQIFTTIAEYYKKQRENGVLMKHHAIHIRDGVPETFVRIQSVQTQGEI